MGNQGKSRISVSKGSHPDSASLTPCLFPPLLRSSQRPPARLPPCSLCFLGFPRPKHICTARPGQGKWTSYVPSCPLFLGSPLTVRRACCGCGAGPLVENRLISALVSDRPESRDTIRKGILYMCQCGRSAGDALVLSALVTNEKCCC